MADAAPPNSRARILAGETGDERTALLIRLTNALEAAEKAHAPTDDEREALTLIVRDVHNYDGRPGFLALAGADAGRIAEAILAAGFRRTEVPEPSAERELTPCGNLVCTGCRVCGCPALGIEPQGEPSDSWIDRQASAIITERHGADPTQGEPSDARRAPLQAVRGVGPKGTISWEEHLEVWNAYAALHGGRQSAERIAERGGFGHSEVRLLLGREPRTFRAGGVR